MYAYVLLFLLCYVPFTESYCDNGLDLLLLVDGQYASEIRAVNRISGEVSQYCGYTKPYDYSLDGDCFGVYFKYIRNMQIKADTTKIYLSTQGQIRVIDVATKTVSTLAGSFSNTTAVDGSSSVAQFDILAYSMDLTIDETKLYMLVGCMFKLYNLNTNIISTIAGSSNCTAAVNGIGTAAQFLSPTTGLIDKAEQYYYVTDLTYIRKIQLSNSQVTTIQGCSATENVNVDSYVRGTITACVYNIKFMAQTSNSTYIYMATATSIRRMRTSDTFIETLVGSNTTSGYANAVGLSARFSAISMMTLSPDELYLYIMDANHLVRKIEIGSWSVSILSGYSATKVGSNNGPASVATYYGNSAVMGAAFLCIPCSDGYYKNNVTGNCERCVANTYCGAGIQKTCSINTPFTVGTCSCSAGKMTSCDSNAYCGQTSKSCYCIDGMYYSDISQTCVVCPASYYCQNNVKTACPVNTYSKQGSRVIQDCTTCAGGVEYIYTTDNSYYLRRLNTKTKATSIVCGPGSFYAVSSNGPCNDMIAGYEPELISTNNDKILYIYQAYAIVRFNVTTLSGVLVGGTGDGSVNYDPIYLATDPGQQQSIINGARAPSMAITSDETKIYFINAEDAVLKMLYLPTYTITDISSGPWVASHTAYAATTYGTLSFDNTKYYLGSSETNTVYAIDLTTYAVTTIQGCGNPSYTNVDSGKIPSLFGSITGCIVPGAMVASPDGKYLYVVQKVTNELKRIRLSDNKMDTVFGSISNGEGRSDLVVGRDAPLGEVTKLTISKDGQYLYVTTWGTINRIEISTWKMTVYINTTFTLDLEGVNVKYDGIFSHALTCTPCNSGYYLGDDYSTCTICPVNTYCVNGVLSDCPINSTSPSGSDSINDCNCTKAKYIYDGVCTNTIPCAMGSYGNGSVCNACPVGYLSNKTGLSACYPCSIGYTNNKTGMSVCDICSPGYSLNGSVCTICPAGSYKSIAGGSCCIACTTCSPYATKSNLCAAGSTSNTVHCDCNAGYYGNGTFCSVCPAGQYQSTSGNNVCLPCSTCHANATIIRNCSIGSTADAVCACNAGFSGNGVSCTACGAGYYKSTVGNASCTLCTVCNTNAKQTGTCNTTKSQSDVVCECNAGYTGNGTSCSICPVNTYKTLVGSSACLACTSCDVNANPSGSCPAGSTSNAITCQCNVGYTGNGVSCTACGAGTYKNTAGSASCTNCTVCSSNAYQTGACISASTTDLVSCACKPGYTGDGATCTICGVNTYKSTNGSASCTSCTTCHANASQTGTCPAGSTSNTITCQCKAGYTGNGSYCSICPAGTYKTLEGTSSCLPCTVCSSNASQSGVCNAGSTSNLVSCQCNLGFTGDGTTCTPCPVNTFKNTYGSASCIACTVCHSNASLTTSCPAQSISDTAVCQCNAGYYGNGTSCSTCSVNTYKSSTGNFACSPCTTCSAYARTSNTCGIGSTSNSVVCECNPGYTGNGTYCSICQNGYYKALYGSSICLGCTVCSTYATQTGACNAGSTQNAITCACNMGYTGAGTTCTACGTGNYKSTVGPAACTACTACDTNANQTSFCGSVSISDTATCACNIGYTGNGTSCSICPAGQYKSTQGTASCSLCTVCDPNANQTGVCDAGSTWDKVSCKCKPGYQAVGTTCVQCTAGHYSSTYAASACIDCSAGYYSDFPMATACIACSSGSIAASIQATACTNCSMGTYTNGTGQSQCLTCNNTCVNGQIKRCNINGVTVCVTPGFWFDDDSTNTTPTGCPIGTYDSQVGYGQSASACVNCPQGQYSETVGSVACLYCFVG